MKKNQHAAKHFHSTNHPLIRSFEPDEEWGWCYVDELLFESLPGSLETEWCAVRWGRRAKKDLDCQYTRRLAFRSCSESTKLLSSGEYVTQRQE